MSDFDFSINDIEAQFMDFMRANNCEPEGNFTLQMDGQLHRFRLHDDRNGQKSGAYCVHTDGWPAGWCQNWRGGETVMWKFAVDDEGKHYDYFSSPEFKKALENSKKQQAEIKAEQEKKRLEAIDQARRICASLPNADYDDEQPYLCNKQIFPYNLKINRTDQRLIVPIQDIDGNIVNVQYIEADGDKKFLPFAPVSANFYAVGLEEVNDTEGGKKKPILIGEGVATMHTVREMTELPCVAAMNCGNIKKVAEAIRGKYPNPIIIMADNDHKKKQNAGKEAAEAANRELKLNGVVMPDFADDEDGTDWNDFFVMHDYDTEICRDAIRKKFMQLPMYNKQQSPTQEQEQPEAVSDLQEAEIISDTEYFDTVFESDKIAFQKYSGRKTGFDNLDREGEFRDTKKRLTLYPGLYIIGAVSSGGKTTFCLQLADNFASMGEHVLFFAFEQTRFELVSKSLARMCQPEKGEQLYSSMPTAIEIRSGSGYPEEVKQRFREISQHKRIIECDFKTDIKKVVNTVEAYIKQYGVKPVVFVDYLQLIRNDGKEFKNRSTKDIVDANVRALKLLQMRHELLMFVISSINRENYATSIDFQSFKESGGIEFTADVVLGLQYYVIHTKTFDGAEKTKINEKRKTLEAAKRANPRQVELHILKNRYGIANTSFYFQYYAKYDLFVPSTFKAVKEATEELLQSLKTDDDNDDEGE